MNLRLLPDYECYPTWVVTAEGSRDISPSDLPISSELASRLMLWQARYDATLLHADPARSGFPTPLDEAAFDADGRDLWRLLRGELGPDVVVTYYSVLEGRHLR